MFTKAANSLTVFRIPHPPGDGSRDMPAESGVAERRRPI